MSALQAMSREELELTLDGIAQCVLDEDLDDLGVVKAIIRVYKSHGLSVADFD